MKHWLIYLALTAAVILTGSLPFSSHDIGELRPVQTILVRAGDGYVVLETDTGDRGTGADWDSAMGDLKAKAPGTVFMGTGSFLLLTADALPLLPELADKQELSPGCALCLAPEQMDLELAGEYLKAHEPDWNLRQLRAALAGGQAVELPSLTQTDGGYLLVQPGN